MELNAYTATAFILLLVLLVYLGIGKARGLF